MSVTITQQPNTNNPVYNPIIIRAKSTEQTRTDFKYIIEVRDSLGAAVANFEQFGGATVDDEVDIDVSGVLQPKHKFNYWRYDVQGSEYVYRISDYRFGFNVTVWEYYDGAQQAQASISPAHSVPISLSDIRFSCFDYVTQIKNNKGRWLTDFELIKVRPTDKLTLQFMNGVEGCVSFNYYFYNGDTLLTSVVKNNPYGTPANFEDVLNVHAGLQEIAAYCGISNTIRDTTTRYIIKQNNLTAIEFQVIPENCFFDGVRVHFMNDWGAVDSFLFELATRRGATIEKKKAKLKFDKSNALRPSVFGLGKSPYLVTYTDSLKLTSNYLTENDSNALLQMFTSPMVAVETEQRLFFPAPKGQKIILPADLELTNYDFKTIQNDRLFNLELDVKISVDNTRQSL